jgi:DNA-binding MarR family transcriptional regulator
LETFNLLQIPRRLLNQAIGTDHTQARILSVINRREPIQKRELEEARAARAAAMSQLPLRLERQGLTTRPRGASEQRRRGALITPAGKAEALARELGARKRPGKLFSRLAADEARAFKAALGKLADRFLDAAGLDEGVQLSSPSPPAGASGHGPPSLEAGRGAPR